jgi:hypothetical protein
VPLTYVLADELSRAAILDAVRAGRTYVSCGPELYFEPVAGGVEARCAAAPPGAEIRVIADDAVTGSSFASAAGEARVRAPGPQVWAYAELWNAKGDLMLAATSPIYPSRK